MAARTLNCAVSNDSPGVPGATPAVYKSPYPGNGGSARADLFSRHTRGNKMQREKTIQNQHKTKLKTPATEIIDLDKNPFQRRGSVSRSPPPSKQETETPEASDIPATREEKQARTTKTCLRESANPGPSGKTDRDPGYVNVEQEQTKSLESDVLRDIYREKESLESFLFNESNKIYRTAIKLIMGKWAILESRLIESILENEKSKAKINELKIENIKLENKNKVIPTYARIFDDGSSGTSKTQPVDLKNKKEVILIRPIKDDDKISNDELRVNVTRALDKIKSKLKVRSIRQISRGGLVIEVDSTRDKELIEAAKLDKIGLKLEEPKRVKPSLIIYDVEKEFRAEELKQQLLWKNIDNVTEGNYNEISKEVEFRHCFNTKNSNRVNWIVQLNGDLWKQLVAKAKVYMNWRVHNIKEYINVGT